MQYIRRVDILALVIVLAVMPTLTTATEKCEIYTMTYNVADLPVWRVENDRPVFDASVVIEFLTTSVEPETWQDGGGEASITAFEKRTSLVVSQTRANHDKVAAALAKLARTKHLAR